MALTANRIRDYGVWERHVFTLTSGQVVYEGGLAAIDLSTGYVVAGAAGSGKLVIGSFVRNYDATSGAIDCEVTLHRPVRVEWFTNSTTGNAVVRANVGSICYLESDCVATMSASSTSILGRVWDISSSRGVAVELLTGSIGAGQTGA